MYGAQTMFNSSSLFTMFENDVEMYGAQTFTGAFLFELCLRMM